MDASVLLKITAQRICCSFFFQLFPKEDNEEVVMLRQHNIISWLSIAVIQV